MREAKTRDRKAKAKDKERTREQHPNRASKATAGQLASVGHKASECWQGYAQGVEEVPSSSASSVAPSAATTPAAAKTAAAIQEVNDENEPGLTFGMVDGSVASVTTDKQHLWDELVFDSGSVSTACPYAWCSDISVNNKEKTYLQDIQQRRIPSHSSRAVPLELLGSGRWC